MGYFNLLLLVLGAIIVNYNGYTDPIVEGIYYTVIGGMIGWLIPIKYNLFYYLFKKIQLVKNTTVPEKNYTNTYSFYSVNDFPEVGENGSTYFATSTKELYLYQINKYVPDINAVKNIKIDTSNIFGANYNNFGNTKLCLGNRGVPQLVYYVNLNSWQRFWLRFMGFKVEKLK